MNPTPHTQHRHALRWVLGVGLVFVVVVALTLQVVRRRADERWGSLVMHWNEEWLRNGVLQRVGPQLPVVQQGSDMEPIWGLLFAGQVSTCSDTSDGNMFRGWRQATRSGSGMCALVLRQERNFFGSIIVARMSGGEPEQIEAVRTILAAVDVDLVVEP